jgi:hypothetical protein
MFFPFVGDRPEPGLGRPELDTVSYVVCDLISRMNTLWPLLVSGGLGIGGALLGTWLTQRAATKRETANWERELQRETARWSREDQSRAFDHRREAYVDFFDELGRVQELVFTLGAGEASGEDYFELLEDWRYAAYKKLQTLALYATPTVAPLAAEAYKATAEWGDNARWGDNAIYGGGRRSLGEADDTENRQVSDSQQASLERKRQFLKGQEFAEKTKNRLLVGIRADLGVPDYPQA